MCSIATDSKPCHLNYVCLYILPLKTKTQVDDNKLKLALVKTSDVNLVSVMTKEY